ncbi:hypothetical protein FB451DRAFT_1127499 [Mycena latifolia]|nr:hypothetical protein FB451DRAFT_1127499 [Mycena latifolia]
MPSASPQSSPVRSSASSDSQDHHTPTTELANGDAEGPDYYLERKKYLDGDGYPLGGGGHKQRYSNDAEEGDMHAVKAEHEEEGEETEKGAHRDIGWVPGLEDFIDETEHPRGSYCDLQESAEDGSGRVYAAALVPTAALHPPLVCACDIDDGQNGRRTLVALLPGGSHQPTDVERNCRLLRGLWCAQVLSIDALCVGLVEDSLWIRMELTERSLANVLSLDVVVSSVDELEPRVMARWANDMRLALDQHNIAHHELRSDNSLLNREGVLKPPDLSNAVCGTPETPLSMDPAGVVYWPAPEVRPGFPAALMIPSKIDVWSVGAEIGEADARWRSPLSGPTLDQPAFRDFLRQCSGPAASRSRRRTADDCDRIRAGGTFAMTNGPKTRSAMCSRLV